MDPYDSSAVRKVWERVRLCHEQLLSSMIAEEAQVRDFFRRLGGQRTPLRRDFLSIAAQEEQHLRQLQELYRKSFGTEPPAERLPPLKYGSLPQALSAQREKALARARSYQKAAVHFSANSELFLSLSREEELLAQRLQDLWQRQRPPHRAYKP